MNDKPWIKCPHCDINFLASTPDDLGGNPSIVDDILQYVWIENVDGKSVLLYNPEKILAIIKKG